MAKKKKEQKVTIFDPSVGAYREITLSKAEEYLENLEQVKKAVKKAKKK